MKIRVKKDKQNIIIVGSGKLGSHIANDYSLNDHNVILVDQDENILKIINAKFGGKTILGNATDINTLIKAGIENADVVIAATNNDNINIFVALIAKEIFNIENVISRLYDSSLAIVYDKLNITTICPSVLSAEAIKDSIKAEKAFFRQQNN